MKTYDIKARFFGNAFKGNVYNLKAMRLLNENIGLIIQQLIAIQLGRNELAGELKDKVVTKPTINQGVLEIGINFERDFFSEFGIDGFGAQSKSFSDDIARLFYSAMLLRRYVAEAKNAGQAIKILLNTTQIKVNRSVVKTEQGNILLSHPKVLWAAQMTKDAADIILGLVDDDNINTFEFEGLSRPFVCNPDDFIVLGQRKSDLVAVANFKGRLDNLFFSRQRGVVVSEDEIYQIVWDETVKRKVLEHADLDGVEFITKPCIETHSLYGELVVYKILDCVVPERNTEQAC